MQICNGNPANDNDEGSTSGLHSYYTVSSNLIQHTLKQLFRAFTIT